MTELLLITGMMLATFSVRLLPFALADRIRLPPLLRSALSYVPIAVLSAIIAPAVIMPKGVIWLDWSNPYLMAAISAVLTAALLRSLLVTIMVGMATTLLVKLISG